MTDFLSVIGDMRNGDVLVDCSKKLGELLDAINRTSGKGKFILTLDIKPGRVDMGRVTEIEIEHSIKLNVPEAKPGVSIFFVSKDQKLTRNDPRQTEMTEMYEEEGVTRHG